MPNSCNKFIIIGSGGHSRVVIDTLESLDHTIFGIIDINYKGKKEKILNHPVIGDLNYLDEINEKDYSIALAFGNCSIRKKIYNKVNKFKLPNIIHPTAIVSQKAKFGKAIFVNSGAIINANAKIRDNVLINTGSIIEHEVQIESHTSVGPGAKIGGRVKIGNSVYVGIGSSIIHSLDIGDDSIIAAGCVVINDVKKSTTVYGVPGKEK